MLKKKRTIDLERSKIFGEDDRESYVEIDARISNADTKSET